MHRVERDRDGDEREQRRGLAHVLDRFRAASDGDPVRRPRRRRRRRAAPRPRSSRPGPLAHRVTIGDVSGADPLLDALVDIVGAPHVLVDAELRAGYETDWTGRFHGDGARGGAARRSGARSRPCSRSATRPARPSSPRAGTPGWSVAACRAAAKSCSASPASRQLDVDGQQGEAIVGAGVVLDHLQEVVRAEGWDLGRRPLLPRVVHDRRDGGDERGRRARPPLRRDGGSGHRGRGRARRRPPRRPGPGAPQGQHRLPLGRRAEPAARARSASSPASTSAWSPA